MHLRPIQRHRAKVEGLTGRRITPRQHCPGLVGDGVVGAVRGDLAADEGDLGQVVVERGAGRLHVDARVVGDVERPLVAELAQGQDAVRREGGVGHQDPHRPVGAIDHHMPRRIGHAGRLEPLAHGGQHAGRVDRKIADRDGDRDQAAGLQRPQIGGHGLGGEGRLIGFRGVQRVRGNVDQVVAGGGRGHGGGQGAAVQDAHPGVASDVRRRGGAESADERRVQLGLGLQHVEMRCAQRQGFAEAEAARGSDHQHLGSLDEPVGSRPQGCRRIAQVQRPAPG